MEPLREGPVYSSYVESVCILGPVGRSSTEFGIFFESECKQSAKPQHPRENKSTNFFAHLMPIADNNAECIVVTASIKEFNAIEIGCTIGWVYCNDD